MIKIHEIDENNLTHVLKLQVADDQIHYIESIEECINDMKTHAYGIEWFGYTLENNHETIGFFMVGLNKEKVCWLDRFFIDKHYQHQGLGKESLSFILEFITQHFEYIDVALSVAYENKIAIHLYESFGFQMSEYMDGNDPVMILKKGNIQ